MKLLCPSCGEFIPGAEIDLRRSIGLCRPCGELVPLPSVVLRDADDTLRSEGSATFTAREIAATPLYAYRPEGCGLTERRLGQRVVLELPEERSGALIVLVGALLWLSLLPLWPEVLRDPEVRGLRALWWAFALLHVSSAGYLCYLGARGLVNRTRLALSAARFTLDHAPLWRPGGVAVALREVRCFIEVSAHITTLPERWFRSPMAYDVTLLTRDQRSIALQLNLHERDHARYIALRLNRALDELRIDEPRPATEVQDVTAALAQEQDLS